VVDPESRRVAEANRLHPNLFNCRQYSAKSLGPEAGCKIPLLDGDGLLDVRGGECRSVELERISAIQNNAALTPEERTFAESQLQRERALRPVVHFSDVQSEGRPLSIPSGELHSTGAGFQYVAWCRCYLLPGYEPKGRIGYNGADWPDGEDFPLYLFDPPDHVRTVRIPWRRFFVGRPTPVVLSREGPVVVRPGARTRKKNYVRGLFLFRNGGPLHVSTSDSQEALVAPDGCRIAFEHRTVERRREPPLLVSLHVIDLCRSE
jgi:hypothetical protein